MTTRAFFARVISIVLVTFATACSGGGNSTDGTAVQPPPASREQLQQIAALPAAERSIGSAAFSDPAPDNGALQPLSVLTVRTSSVTPYSVTTCSSTAACIGGTNSSTGPGVAGLSSLGKGVTGTTTFASTSTSNGQYGVYGQDSSSSGGFDVGVYGLSVRGIGVSGKSTNNYGVRGTSGAIGVYGVSTGSWGVYGSGPIRGVSGAGGPTGVYGTGTSYGVYGNGAANSSGTNGVGVYGSSPSNIAVEGSSGNYIGVYGLSNGYVGLYGAGPSYGIIGTTSGGIGGSFSSSSNRALEGVSSSGTGVYASSSTGYGLESHSGGSVGAYITNSAGNGADVTGSYIGVIARGPTTGFPLVVTDDGGNNLFYVAGNGNVYYHGSLNTFASTTSGAQAAAYSPQSTRPAIEDTGTANLVNGRAVVMLDPTFARTIDTQHPYQVFLTPGGDTRGLYVASKSPTQFVVHEVQGGRGSFSFDYHVYAVALGKAAERMRIVQPDARPLRAPASAPVPRVLVSPRPQQ